MKKNKKELIIESFEKMDLEMLDILLDSNKTYQGATKEVFLEKLKIAFSELKVSGDTLLISYKGFCNYNDCPNKGCSGYSFLGNKSKNHIDLIFDEINDSIQDINHCNGFETVEKLTDKEKLVYIEIMNDEKAAFNPNIDFLIKSQKCKLAYEELIHFQNTIIDKEIYLAWLEKFYPLYQSCLYSSNLYVELNKFYWLYVRINELKEFLESDNLANEAIKEFKNIEKRNETELLKWLTKYEQTDYNLSLFLYEEIDFKYPEKSEYFKVNGLKINTSDFKNIASFKFLFDKHYWKMLKKYTTLTDDEKKRQFIENSRITQNTFSLTYHLNKRGIQL